MKKQRWRFTKGYWDWKCSDCGVWGFHKGKKCKVPKGWSLDGYGFVFVLCDKCTKRSSDEK